MKNLIYSFLILLAAAGCQKSASEPAEIELDNGKKWQVNTEMAAHIEAMETDVANYRSGDDITQLQTSLKENISQLSSKCTMEGKAHDELHKWLVPFIETVNEMQEENPDSSIKKLGNRFGNYHYYFETGTDAV